MDATTTPLGVAVASAPPDQVPLAPVVAKPVAPVWPRSAQLAAAGLLALTLGLLGWHVWERQRGRARPTELEPGVLAFRVDLNRADRAQLLQIPGVGPALAERIEEYRLEHYGFRDLEELRLIHGVGPATFERLRSSVYVEPHEGNDEHPVPLGARPPPVRKEMPAVKPAATKKEATPTAPLDINKATAEEWQRLPGIGPTLSERIVEKRKETPFKSVDDLRKVSGIGVKTLEKLRPFVTVGASAPGGRVK